MRYNVSGWVSGLPVGEFETLAKGKTRYNFRLMIFHGTKLPDAVSIALDKGELAIFVGAGISKPPPSNLPLFDGLVVEIGKQFGINVSIDEICGNEDQILGKWHDEKREVHKAAVKILGNERSKPTELHHELFRIFKESKKVDETSSGLKGFRYLSDK